MLRWIAFGITGLVLMPFIRLALANLPTEWTTNGLTAIGFPPATWTVNGLTVTVEGVELHGLSSDLFSNWVRQYWYTHPESLYKTVVNYSVSSPDWALKRLKYTNSAGRVREVLWPSYPAIPGCNLSEPLWSDEGPYEFELGFREVRDNGLPFGGKFEIPALPKPGAELLVPYDVTAFGATFHLLGVYGVGCLLPNGQVATLPCVVFSVQGDPKAAFTVFASRLDVQPLVADETTDYHAAPGSFVLTLAAYDQRCEVHVMSVGAEERVFHFKVNVPQVIYPYVFDSIN